MFRSANDVVAGEGSVMEAGHLSDIVGQVRTVVGSAHLIRTSGVNAQIYVGISVYQGRGVNGQQTTRESAKAATRVRTW